MINFTSSTNVSLAETYTLAKDVFHFELSDSPQRGSCLQEGVRGCPILRNDQRGPGHVILSDWILAVAVILYILTCSMSWREVRGSRIGSKADYHHGCTKKPEPAVVLSSSISEKLSDQQKLNTLEGTDWLGALTVSV